MNRLAFITLLIFAGLLVSGYATSDSSIFSRKEVLWESVASTSTSLAVPTPTEEPVSILAFGDLMLDREVRREIENHTPMYPFEKIAELLKGHDIVVANAEGPFAENPIRAVAYAPVPIFAFKAEYLSTLRDVGFTLLSQANNHAYDEGPEGLSQSKSLIRASGLGVFGDYENVDPGPYMVNVRGQKLAFVGYHQFTYSADAVFTAIERAHKDGAFVIVYPHWGVEYGEEVSELQRERAHAFVDMGADLVLGSHPHVIEPIEVYKGKAIFYSLGNFIFDQPAEKATREGLAVEVSIASSSVAFTLHPFDIIQEQASLMQKEEASELISSLAERSVVDEGIKHSLIQSGMFILSHRAIQK